MRESRERSENGEIGQGMESRAEKAVREETEQSRRRQRKMKREDREQRENGESREREDREWKGPIPQTTHQQFIMAPLQSSPDHPGSPEISTDHSDVRIGSRDRLLAHRESPSGLSSDTTQVSHNRER